MPGAAELFLLLFADEAILLSDASASLQNQLNALKEEAHRLTLAVNARKAKILIFRKGSCLAIYEDWWYGNVKVKVENTYIYLE